MSLRYKNSSPFRRHPMTGKRYNQPSCHAYGRWVREGGIEFVSHCFVRPYPVLGREDGNTTLTNWWGRRSSLTCFLSLCSLCSKYFSLAKNNHFVYTHTHGVGYAKSLGLTVQKNNMLAWGIQSDGSQRHFIISRHYFSFYTSFELLYQVAFKSV